MLTAIQASAVAAGCAAVIKPSEANPHFNRLLAELLPQYLDSELYHVVQGGVPEMTKVRTRLTPRSLVLMLVLTDP